MYKYKPEDFKDVALDEHLQDYYDQKELTSKEATDYNQSVLEQMQRDLIIYIKSVCAMCLMPNELALEMVEHFEVDLCN